MSARAPRARRFTVGLALALLAALALVGINEYSHLRSRQAIGETLELMEIRSSLQQLLLQLLDAEAGQRGYLITGDEQYLRPYRQAMGAIDDTFSALSALSGKRSDTQASLKELRQHVSGKLGEMEVTVRLRGGGDEAAWKSVIETDLGRQHMEAIRTQSLQMINAVSRKIELAQQQVLETLQLSRVGIAVASLVGLLAFMLYLRQTRVLQRVAVEKEQLLKHERDTLEDMVGERTAQLTELATYLQNVREDERARLARELHDELGALLTAAKLDLARMKSRLTASGPEVAERLQHMSEMLNGGIALKRRIIEDLRPSSLTNLGLNAALENLAHDFAARSGLRVDTELETAQLPPAAELTIYRLVQESLTNIAKYAQARTVQIRLRALANQVQVSVQDDGVGFDPAAVARSSHGFNGMRHRLQAARGRLEIESAPGQGTRVRGYLPISQP